MSFAVFVLSTGRCGTQWLAEQLREFYRDHLWVEHEPLHDRYLARQMLGANSPLRLATNDAEPILSHVQTIEQHLERQPYLECGHPCWSTIPYLADRFQGRIRVVHLTRHPLPTARSWLTHMAYEPPLLPHLKEKVLLSPFDEGVAFPEYQDRWAALTPFEKCLFYWAEVNAFGLKQQEQLGVPWLRISFEELFNGDAMMRLLSFLELAPQESILQARTERIDKHRFVAMSQPNFGLITEHPRVLEVAEKLGYDANSY